MTGRDMWIRSGTKGIASLEKASWSKKTKSIKHEYIYMKINYVRKQHETKDILNSLLDPWNVKRAWHLVISYNSKCS